MKAGERIVAHAVVPLDFTYNYRVGQYIERYIKALGEKKIMAVKCQDCGRVFVPPRKICGTCNRILDEWVEVGPEGTIEIFTIGHVKLNKGLVEKIDKPSIIAMVKLDGASSLLPCVINGLDPEKVKKGLRVKAVFKEPPEDSLFDLDHFEPVG